MTSTGARGSGSLQFGAFKTYDPLCSPFEHEQLEQQSKPVYFVDENSTEFLIANVGVILRRVD